MTKEEIYDEQISPLMRQIIALCKEHKIANVCTFSLDLEKGLCCTTVMTGDEFDSPQKFKDCVKLLYPKPQVMTTMVVTCGEGEVATNEVAINGQ